MCGGISYVVVVIGWHCGLAKGVMIDEYRACITGKLERRTCPRGYSAHKWM